METTKPKFKINFRRTGIIALVIYIVLLIGPVAGLDFPAIAAAIKANPMQLVQFLIIGISNGAIIAATYVRGLGDRASPGPVFTGQYRQVSHLGSDYSDIRVLFSSLGCFA